MTSYFDTNFVCEYIIHLIPRLECHTRFSYRKDMSDNGYNVHYV